MIFAIIVAAGRGERFGGDQKKQFLPLAGKPVLIHSLATFQKSPLVDEILCVVSKEDLAFTENLVSEDALPKVRTILPGGPRRQDSVGLAVAHLEKRGKADDVVLVHDGVRPLVTDALIERVAQGVKKHGAAVAACRVTDSLKEVSEAGVIEKSLPRERTWTMQTPQGFHLSILAEACSKSSADAFEATDEAMLVERLGVSISCVEGLSENIKITNPSDLKMAEYLIRLRETASEQKYAEAFYS